MTVVDAHQHIWDPTHGGYAWQAREPEILRRPIGLDEALRELDVAGVDATVLVQADDTDADTDAMLAAAASSPRVVGVVGYVPLHEPARAAVRLEELRRDPLFVGVRNLMHDRSDPDWLLRPDVAEGLTLLEDAGVPFDAVGVLPRHLESVPIIAEAHPRLRIVIDHLNKPPIGLDSREPWWTLIARAAEHPLVTAKVSGLYSATDDGASWSVDELRPFVERTHELFGADRMMYGGDWPVSVPNGGYARIWAALSELFDELPASQRAAITGGTAQRFYGLSQERLDAAAAAAAAVTSP